MNDDRDLASGKETMAYESKTKPTSVPPLEFIDSVENAMRREDVKVLLALFERVSGWRPYMFGPTIVGYGHYAYTYPTGHSGTACCIGFSPRRANLVIYSGLYPHESKDILAKLGKHKTSKGCIYVNKLADIDLEVLEALLEAGIANMTRQWPVTAS